jgi:hypothetical protein
LNGSIPLGIGNCTTLWALDLSNNQFSGEVPEALWALGKIDTVYLRNSSLTGSLPATMSSSLRWLDIGSNQFTGKIAAVAGGLIHFLADNSQFSGEIPANISYGMPQLKQLNLANNKLSGMIG